MFKIRIKINLFWKILLLFWLIFVVVFSFNRLLINLNDENIRYRPLPPYLHKQLDKARDRLIVALRKHPRLKESKNQLLRRIYLLDSQGHDFFGKKISEMLSQLNRQVIKAQSPFIAIQKQQLVFGGLPITFSDKSYKVYLTENLSFLSRGYLGLLAREFSQSLLVSTFLISFPISFLLAWFFTRPIKKLQLAVKELSKDLAERKNLAPLLKRRDEFGDLARDFDSMALDLGEIIDSKDQLLSDVSHELKLPLTRLQIALGLAVKKDKYSENFDLKRIKLEADRMSQMITSLLDYSKFDRQDIRQKKEVFDVCELIEILVNDAAFESKQKEILIKADLHKKILIAATKHMIISCIENILRNAIRYASTKISIACEIEQRLQQSKKIDQILITISDDGYGIQNDQKEKIFEAFYRPETDRSRHSGGVGLGLSIAKKAIDAHNGKIYAENIRPHGLKVSIILPLD